MNGRGHPVFNRIRSVRQFHGNWFQHLQMTSTLKEHNTMNRHHTLTLAFMAVMTFMNVGCAQQGSAVFSQDPTKLSGTWVGTSNTLNSRGETGTRKTVTLVVNELGSIRGSAQWTKTSGIGGHNEDKRTDNDQEELIGSLNKSDGVFFLVETSETGFWYCRTMNSDLVLAHLIQSGPKHVSTFVEFTRLQESE